jgi:hypothetical protein
MAIDIVETRETEYYTILKLREDWSTIKDIEIWCSQTGCGKRVNYHSFAFKNEAELTMFRLRWT